MQIEYYLNIGGLASKIYIFKIHVLYLFELSTKANMQFFTENFTESSLVYLSFAYSYIYYSSDYKTHYRWVLKSYTFLFTYKTLYVK